MHYYQVVKRLIEEFSPGKLLVDVGAWNTPVVTWGTFERRVSIDLHSRPRNDPRVEEIVAALRFIIATPTLTGQVLTLDGGQRFLGLGRDVQFLEHR